MSMTAKFRLALVQLSVSRYREKNLVKTSKLIREAARNGASVIALPEFFTCWMDPKYFAEYKEPLMGPTYQMLSKAAKDNKVFIFGGTFPEEVPNSKKHRNTCQIYNPNGEVISRFSKLHMFDVDLGPRMKITESEICEGGRTFTAVDTGFCKTGFGVCIDLRYPEVSRLYNMRGCQLITFMGGFSMKTGPAHWEILQRARAVDNQLFVANIGPASNYEAPYVTYGHSAVADPWGNLIAKTGSEEDTVHADIDLSLIAEIRRQMPLDHMRRNDLFQTVDLTTCSEPKN